MMITVEEVCSACEQDFNRNGMYVGHERDRIFISLTNGYQVSITRYEQGYTVCSIAGNDVRYDLERVSGLTTLDEILVHARRMINILGYMIPPHDMFKNNYNTITKLLNCGVNLVKEK